MTRDGDPALPRCETLYVAVVTNNLASIQQSLYTVTANLVRSGLDESCDDPDAGPPVGDDAGVMGADDAGPGSMMMGGSDGCGCRAASTDSRGLAGLLVLLGLVGLVRGRRRA